MRWLVFDQTHSEFMLGIVEVASLMPGLLVGLFAGMLADRVQPLRMIVLMEIGQMILAFALALVVWLKVFHVWQLVLILALARICVTFELPSRQVFFFELVGFENLPNAIALNSGLFNATRVVGPARSRGEPPHCWGRPGCFASNGVTYVAAIAAVLSIRLAARPRSLIAEAFSIKELLGGLGYLRNDRRIFAQFALVAFFGFVGMGYEAMIPAYARTVVGTGVYGYSVLLAWSGVGATVGAFVIASLGGVVRKERLTIAGMVIFGGSLAAAVVLPTVVAQVPNGSARLVAASACLLVAGSALVLFYSSSMTLIQLAPPDHLRGRIMGIWMIVYSGSVPLGALWTGRVAQSWGVSIVMGFSALLCVVVGLIVWASGVLAPTRHVTTSGIDSSP